MDHVLGGPGDDVGLADRAAALGHHGAGDHGGVEQDADGAVDVDLVVEHEAVPAGRLRRRGHAADHLQPGRLRPQAVQHALGRERERVGQQHEDPVGVVLGPGRQAGQGPAAVEPLRLQADRLDGPHPAGPEADRGPLFDLAGPAHDRAGGGPEQRPGPQHRADGLGDLGHEPEVRRGDEQDREVGLLADLLQDLAHHLARGLGGQRVLGDGGAEAHVGGGSIVYGTERTGPWSTRHRATTVPYSSKSISPRTRRCVNRPGSTCSGWTLRASCSPPDSRS